MAFHSPAGTPKVIYVSELPLTANQPCTFTHDNPSKMSLTPAADGKSVTVTCLVPLTAVAVTTNLTAHTPEGVTGSCQVTFDVDPSIATSISLGETPPA